MTRSTKDVLIAARKLIEKPENWTNKSPKMFGLPTCAGFAIERSGDYGLWQFCKAMGFSSSSEISYWNDAPERTHAEVLAAFDKAIAECGA